MGGGFEPRYSSKEIFEKDFSKTEIIPQTVRCPGCGEIINLNRKSNYGKSAGWCKKCSRAVTL
ncbi:MAG: hypothetical protein N2Z20_01920 [Elusimicrobiales bacterium]|nr:hypothetical protein [Elusimicrobiales bacterium]